MVTQKNNIFLDYNATTPVLLEAKDVLLDAMDLPLNASSTHSFGRAGKKILREARSLVTSKLGAEGATVIFTASGTESNNMALRGLGGVGKILISSIEHDSVMKPASFLNSALINVDKNGLLNLGHLARECEELKANNISFLASIIHSNNETGVVQDISKIAPIIYENGGYLHIDASQSIGKIPFDFNGLNVDMATISSHKVGGAKGAAALIVKSGLEIKPLLYGGSQEKYLRAGTENIPAIASFAKAVENSVDKLAAYKEHTEALINKFENGLRNISEDIQIFSEQVDRLPNTSNFSLPECDNETTLINLDLKGFAVSAGSACSSGRVVTSHVLGAMGVNDKVAKTALRLSVGLGSKKEEIDKILLEIERIYAKKHLKSAA